MSEPVQTELAQERFEAAVAKLPPRLRARAEWLFAQWPGRVGLRIAATCMRIELFDRSMTIAAQFFTSVFPTVILLAALIGWNGNEVANTLAVPDETRVILDDALGTTGSDTAAFGVIGTIIVLGSATSLSRALTRAFAAVWGLARPNVRLTNAWRWVAVVIVLALALVATRALARFVADLPPPTLWELGLSLLFDLSVGVFVPWVLLAGQVSARRLAPGALVFGVVMLFLRPASALWLPLALDSSADRYGAIGVAFTYLAWLYVVSFCFLTSHVIGQVVTTDDGVLGRLIRGSDGPTS